MLDGLTNPMNVSAILRTVEALGLQEVHVVHPQGKVLRARSITKSSEKWLDVHWWRNGRSSFDHLRESGCRIWVADFGDGAVPLSEIPLEGPTALVFGPEQLGVSSETKAAADGLFHIPTAGFVSYLNVSVMAAIALHETDRRLRDLSLRRPLSDEEKRALRLAWYPALAGGRARAIEYLAWVDSPPEPAPLVKLVPSREKAQEG